MIQVTVRALTYNTRSRVLGQYNSKLFIQNSQAFMCMIHKFSRDDNYRSIIINFHMRINQLQLETTFIRSYDSKILKP